jgi:hypothetical protein
MLSSRKPSAGSSNAELLDLSPRSSVPLTSYRLDSKIAWKCLIYTPLLNHLEHLEPSDFSGYKKVKRRRPTVKMLRQAYYWFFKKKRQLNHELQKLQDEA